MVSAMPEQERLLLGWQPLFSKKGDNTVKIKLRICLLLCLSVFCAWTAVSGIEKIYHSQLVSIHQVYDGDTLKDVRVKVFDFGSTEFGEVWAGVYVAQDGVYVKTDIRVNGIDTPEKRVSTKNADGSKRSEASRTRERQAAYASRQALVDLLKSNNLRVQLSNPIHGKYAGRTVADVSVGGVDVAEFLIKAGHAKPYAGGTKPDWGWGK